jgi:regulator of nonsense transcripts 2
VETELTSALKSGSGRSLDSSLKRYTAFIKKVRQSVGAENRDQLLKDIETLSLEKYVDELDSAVLEGISKCKSERDVWSAVEVRLSILLFLRIISCGGRGFLVCR